MVDVRRGPVTFAVQFPAPGYREGLGARKRGSGGRRARDGDFLFYRDNSMMYDYRDTVRSDARNRHKKDFLPRPKEQRGRGRESSEYREAARSTGVGEAATTIKRAEDEEAQR